LITHKIQEMRKVIGQPVQHWSQIKQNRFTYHFPHFLYFMCDQCWTGWPIPSLISMLCFMCDQCWTGWPIPSLISLLCFICGQFWTDWPIPSFISLLCFICGQCDHI
jgi:hypothetical protein